MHIVKVVFVELQIDHVERREFKGSSKKGYFVWLNSLTTENTYMGLGSGKGEEY